MVQQPAFQIKLLLPMLPGFSSPATTKQNLPLKISSLRGCWRSEWAQGRRKSNNEWKRKRENNGGKGKAMEEAVVNRGKPEDTEIWTLIMIK